MIEGRNLYKAYKGKAVLENASFRIENGSITGLYGENGCGKSTLSRILCGVVIPDAGEIRIDDTVLVSEKNPYNRKEGLTIQMVYQQPQTALDPSQKIGDGLRELIRFHRFASSAKERNRIIDEIISDVGLERDILNHLPSQISGGEAQRICIARCLLFQPRLMIMDEATSMLDVSTQANILGLIRRSVTNGERSVLFISHDRLLVERYCDRIYLMQNHYVKEEKRV